MYKIKLVVNSYERWLTSLRYEYFCPVEMDPEYYKKYLQKNFPFESADTTDMAMAPYNHRTIPVVKISEYDKKLIKDSLREAEFAVKHGESDIGAKEFSSFGEKNPLKSKYYTKLAKARQRNGLDYGIAPNYTYNYDSYIRPVQQITKPIEYNKFGGIFNLTLDSGEDDDFLYEWLLQGDMKQGKLVFYDGDLDQAFKIEFWDCYCISVGEQMTSTGSSAMQMNLRLSPAITRNRSEEHQKVWKVTDITPNDKAFGPGPVDDEPVQEPEWIESYITDMQGKRIDDYQIGDTIIVVFKTRHLVGKKISLNLDDKDADFEYNGNRLENDILSNYLVNNNTEQVELTVIEQA
ncbi:type VI secretion system tube protein TssD [Saccharicrinis aurantiacus]|uniref:type VI secretion system tube protein TssD n=1 Tax=Saccharicrinis aurantiacus TaxID=1849719 RepID=UPI0008386F99|nr:type VI secretion system tube protein TssD [Saccharicrinis aurantiacus]